MYQIKQNPIIHHISTLYNLLGIWENDEKSVFRKVGKKLFYIIFMLTFGVAVATGAYLTDNKNESIFLASMAIADFIVFVKLNFLVWRKKEILAFLSDVGVYTFTDQQEFIEMRRKLTSFTYISYYLLFIFFFVLTALPISCLSVFSGEKRLPLNIAFPLNWKSSEIVYWIAFIYFECGTFIVGFTSLNMLTVWYLMINYSIQYQMLGNKFKSLGVTKKTVEIVQKPKISKVSHEQKQNLYLQDLIKLIKIHQHIQETVEKFRVCYCNVFFAQITTSAIDICGMIYALAFSSEGNLVEDAIFFACVIYCLLDIFMIMYFGNEIKLSSSQLSYCLFQSNWVDQSYSSKKCIIILTEVLKQPQELIIFKLYPLDLETFTRILNLAYSMFNILQNLNKCE